MYEFTKQLKRKTIIPNEIMIHFGFPKSITNNQKPYSNEAWREKKLKHKLEKILFSILDVTLNEEFYTQKMKLNLSNEALHVGFKIALKRLIKSTTPGGIVTKSILLDIHYMYDRVNDMAKLLDVIDKTDLTSFL
jgi:hypothetical protein